MLGFLRRLTELRRGRVVVQHTPLDDFADAAFPIVTVPFHGTTVPVKLRELTQVQIRACGDFSLIKTFEDKVRAMSGKPTMAEINAYSERYHAIAEAAMVAPTYDQLLGMYDRDAKVRSARKKLDQAEKLLAKTPKGPQRAALEEQVQSLRIWTDLILPEDFLSAVMSYALGMDKSDIDDVTDDVLLDAAILAERGKDNPADHLDGRFTPFMRDDINRRAWSAYSKWMDTHRPKDGKKKVPNAR